jgi:hypothetical protein
VKNCCKFLRTQHAIFKLDTNHLTVKKIQVCPNERPGPLQRGDNHEKIG